MTTLIIFDCDGVLVDSESLAAEVFSYTLSHYKIDLSPTECKTLFKGQSLPYCYRYIEKHFSLTLPKNFDAQLKKNTRTAFDAHLKPVEGAEEILRFLKKKNISFCVASNGDHKKLKHSLEITNLNKYFSNNVFSAEDVSRGKPAPDLFIYAAKKMEATIDKCWVIEDSCAGVEAALAAKMNTVYFSPDNEPLPKTLHTPPLCIQHLNQIKLIGASD